MKFGDDITVSGRSRNEYKEICNIRIAGIVDSLEPYIPRNYQLEDYNSVIVIILSRERYEKELKEKTIPYSYIYISTNEPYKIEENLDNINEKLQGISVRGENLYEQRLEKESIKALFRFILYVADIVVTLFCMGNILYIISSSTMFRKKDFAILRSIGMSEKQIDKMLIFEGILYGGSGLIIGSSTSIGGLNIFGKILNQANLYLFSLPYIYILYATILVYGVIAIAMLSARRKIKKRNIIDEIKEENI